MTSTISKYGKITNPIIKLAVSLTVLGIIYAIISILPGTQLLIQNTYPFSITFITSMGIGVAIIIVILKFDKELANVIKYIIPTHPEISVIISNLIKLSAIWVGYSSFRGVMYSFSQYNWIYSVIFLGISIIPVTRIIITLIKNIGRWSDLIQGKLVGVEQSTTSQINKCSKCNASIPYQDKFCKSCGNKIVRSS